MLTIFTIKSHDDTHDLILSLVLKFPFQAFRKIDANKSGTAGIDEVKKFFCAHKHPLVTSGQ